MTLEELKQTIAEDVPITDYLELIEFLQRELTYRCPNCGGTELTACMPQYVTFRIKGRRVDGKVQVDASNSRIEDHPDQNNYVVHCDTCGAEWDETDEVLTWD